MKTAKATLLELLDENLEQIKFHIINEDYYDNLQKDKIIEADGINDILDIFENMREGFDLLILALDHIEVDYVYTDKTIEDETNN